MTGIAVKAGGMPLEEGIAQRFGLLVGLVAGLCGGYFNRTTSFSISSTDPSQLLANLKAIAQDMGYQLMDDSPNNRFEEDVLVYQRSGLSALFSGRVFFQIEDKQVTVAARSIQLKRLQQAIDTPD